MFFSLIILSGIVTFFILAASIKNKFDANPQTTNGINHNYFTSTYKGITHVFIAVDREDDDVRFIVRDEKWYDAPFKFFKLIKEFQSGDSKFDNEIFLLSDQNRVNAIIKNNADLREHFLRISALCSDKNFSLVKLAFAKQKILLHVRFRKSSLGGDDVAVVVETLDKIRTVFKEELQSTQNFVRDKKPMVFWYDKGPLILGSLWLNGLICFAIYGMSGGWFGGQVIDYNPMLHDALRITIYIEAVLCSIIAFLLFNTSRFHIVLMQLLLCSIGIWMNIVCLLGCANTDFDFKSNDKIQRAVVLQKKVILQEKSSNEYEINVRDLAGSAAPYNITISNKFYNTVAEEDVVDVIRKPGFLGYEWIKDVKLSK